MGQEELIPKPRIKIERPQIERIGVILYAMSFLSFCLVAFALWILILEWVGDPLPFYLRSIIP